MCTGSTRYVESRSRNRNPNLHGDLSGGSLETVFHTSCVDSTCILEDHAHAHLAILEGLVLGRVVVRKAEGIVSHFAQTKLHDVTHVRSTRDVVDQNFTCSTVANLFQSNEDIILAQLHHQEKTHHVNVFLLEVKVCVLSGRLAHCALRQGKHQKHSTTHVGSQIQEHVQVPHNIPIPNFRVHIVLEKHNCPGAGITRFGNQRRRVTGSKCDAKIFIQMIR